MNILYKFKLKMVKVDSITTEREKNVLECSIYNFFKVVTSFLTYLTLKAQGIFEVIKKNCF